MKILFISVLALFTISCADSSSSKNQKNSSVFEGTWLGEDINEYLTTRDSKVICENIEKDEYTNNKYELRIDGYVITSNGDVNDFRINDSAVGPLWKVRDDGATYSNIIIGGGGEGTQDIVSMRMTKKSDNLISVDWTLRSKAGEAYLSSVFYYRMTTQEIFEIRAVFNECVRNLKP